MLIFGLRSTSDDQLGWSMDSNPIHHPSAAKTVKCSFLYYIQHVMLARLVNGLEPHPPLLPSQKMKCSFLGYVHLLMISQAVRWTQTPSASPLQPIIWNAHICITFIFWWSAGLVNGLEPHPPPVSCQKNEMLIFWLCSTSDDWPGWSMDSNPIHHPSPPKKMKCSFLDYVELLMISRACQWTWTASTTCLQPKKWNAHILIMFNFWCWPDWSMDSNPIHHPSPAKKNEMLVFGLRSLLMMCLADWWTWTSSATPLQQ